MSHRKRKRKLIFLRGQTFGYQSKTSTECRKETAFRELGIKVREDLTQDARILRLLRKDLTEKGFGALARSLNMFDARLIRTGIPHPVFRKVNRELPHLG